MRFVLFVIPISPLSSFRSCGYFTNRQETGMWKNEITMISIYKLSSFILERERKVLVTKHVT